MTSYEMFFFFLFSSIVLTSAIFVIYSSNTVYSVFFLILAFVNSSGLLLLSEIEFIAFMLIIIYVGAITILFLFVIMMLDIPSTKKKKKENSNFGYLPILSFLILIFFLETSLMFSKNLTLFYHLIYKSSVYSRFFYKKEVINELDFISNIETLGQILYNYYSIFFLMSGIILLIALIGAVALTKKELRYKKVLQNSLFKQISRNSFQAIFKIN